MNAYSPNLWLLAWRRLCTNFVGMASLAIVSIYLLIVIGAASGLIASNWNKEVAINYAAPGFIGTQKPFVDISTKKDALPENLLDPLKNILQKLNAELRTKNIATEIKKRSTLLFGADRWGRDVIQKTIKGAQTSITVGLIAAFLATLLGTIFGAFSGYLGGWVDDTFNWFYNVFTSIPYLLLVLSVAAVLQYKGITSIVLIFALTGWTGTFRLIRAEYLKHKEREYVLAADAIGASNCRKMFAHIFPNVSHVALVQMSISVVGFIKAEVILSFLGFGVPVGVVSWGSMLNEAQNELILGKWWQLAAATIAMGILVSAFSLLTEALRDALDPKVKGKS